MLTFVQCEDPQYPEKSKDNAISNFMIQIPGKEGWFFPTSTAPYGDTIKIDIPYTYPVESDDVTDLSKLRVQAIIPDGAVISPSLGMIDCSSAFETFVRASNGDVKKYVIKANLKKSSEKDILKFTLPGLDNLEAIVEKDKGKVGIMIPLEWPVDTLNSQNAVIELSPKATISPDPAEKHDFRDGFVFTVTAQDGSTKEFTVAYKEPQKLDKGIGYIKKIWSKSSTTLAFTDHLESGMTVVGDYIILNGKGGPCRVLDKKSGAFVKNLDHTGFDGLCFQVTSDDAGHIIACNYAGAWGASAFKMYKWDNIDATPELLTEWNYDASFLNTGAAEGLGRKFSVTGDINADAVIYTSVAKSNRVVGWQVTGGVVASTPEVVTYPGFAAPWSFLAKADAVSANMSDGFVFAEALSKTLAFYKDGTSTAIPVTIGCSISAMEYFEFNNAKYVAVLDMEWDFRSHKLMVMDITDMANTKLVFESEWILANGAQNLNCTGAIALDKAADGNSVMIYGMGTNAGIIKYKLTNIDTSNN